MLDEELLFAGGNLEKQLSYWMADLDCTIAY